MIMKKIAYIIESLYNSAGMEREIPLKANALSAYYDVTFITRDQQGRPPFTKLDPRVKLIDCAAHDKEEYRAALEKILMKNRYDICLATGGLEFYFLYKIKDGSKKIFEFHFSYDISRVWMGSQMSGVKLWLFSTLQKMRRIWIAKHYDRVVLTCKTDCDKWRRWIPSATYIYNPLTVDPQSTSSCDSKKVIAVGRLDYQKGFDMLIHLWASVAKKHPDWQLTIYGEGKLRLDLEQQVKDLQLQDTVSLPGRTTAIEEKYLESSIFVLSSRDEAFGLVITEAEACGLPIVTFDCPSAPAELVKDSTNGFIVPLGDEEAMADCICRLIEDASLRKEFGKASVAFAKQFHVDNIAKQWKELFEETLRYE